PRRVTTEWAPVLDVRVIGVFAYPEGGHPLIGFFAESVRLEILLPATGQYFQALAGLPLAIADDGENQDGLPAGAAIPSGREYAQLYVREIGRASCRERVWIWVGAGCMKRKEKRE